MAYTRTWAQVNNLLGSRDADEIDDASRETHTDLTERFSDIVYDVNADPWVLKTPGVAINGNQSYALPVHGASIFSGNLVRDNFDVYPAAPSTTTVILIPIAFPRDATVVSFEIRGFRTAVDATVQASLIELDSTTATFSTLANISLPSAIAGIQTAASGAINAAAPFNKSYYIKAFLTAGAGGATTARLSSVYYTVKLPGTP